MLILWLHYAIDLETVYQSGQRPGFWDLSFVSTAYSPGQVTEAPCVDFLLV